MYLLRVFIVELVYFVFANNLSTTLILIKWTASQAKQVEELLEFVRNEMDDRTKNKECFYRLGRVNSCLLSCQASSDDGGSGFRRVL